MCPYQPARKGQRENRKMDKEYEVHLQKIKSKLGINSMGRDLNTSIRKV
jgi:hypothetical protein